MIVVDLFCGLGGFSQAFRDRGHRVIGVDIVPPADVIADVKHLPFNGRLRPDVVLASPPCQDFSRWSMRGLNVKRGIPHKDPDMGLLEATIAAVEQLKPRWWVLENVKGAQEWFRPYLGLASMHVGSRFLWGSFPLPLGIEHHEC